MPSSSFSYRKLKLLQIFLAKYFTIENTLPKPAFYPIYLLCKGLEKVFDETAIFGTLPHGYQQQYFITYTL